MTREQWLEARRCGIGGSDAPTILNINPFSSRMDLWLDKTGQFIEDIDNEAMHWGVKLEDIVAQEFCERTGLKVQRVNQILKHPDHDWMLANIDRRVVGEKAGLECKTTNAFYKDTGEVPPYYYAQVQHYMAVTGWEKWYIAVLAGGQRMYIYEVSRSEGYINDLVEAEAEFWQLVKDECPPELDGSDASSRVVARMYPEAVKGELIELPDDAFSLIQQYEEASETEKVAKEAKEEAANKLKAMLGEAEKGTIFDRTVSWTNVTSKRFDTKRFQDEKEALYKEYLNESSYRRFAVK